MPPSHYPSGARRDGYTQTIRAAGFNGIADTIWAAECRKKIFDRLGGGRECDDTSGRLNFTASRATRLAANANGKLFFNGPMTVEKFDPFPVHPDERTSPDRPGWSVSCQNRKSLTSVAPSQAEHRSVAWLGGQASYWHIATRVTAKQRITTMFDRPETDLFQKSRALAQYLPRIAM